MEFHLLGILFMFIGSSTVTTASFLPFSTLSAYKTSKHYGQPASADDQLYANNRRSLTAVKLPFRRSETAPVELQDEMVNEIINGDISAHELAKRIDDREGEAVAKMICHEALAKHLRKTISTTSKDATDVTKAATRGFFDSFGFTGNSDATDNRKKESQSPKFRFDSYLPVPDTSFINKFVEQGKNLIGGMMTAFGYHI